MAPDAGTFRMETKSVSDKRSVDAGETRCGSVRENVHELSSENIMVPDDININETTENIRDESITMPEAIQEKASNEELGTSSDDVNTETLYRETDSLPDRSVDVDDISCGSIDETEHTVSSEDTMVNVDEDDENVPRVDDTDLHDWASQNDAFSGNDVSVKENFFRRHRKKVKNLMPSHLPGTPKSFKSYLDGIFQAKETLHPERLSIHKRCGSTASGNNSRFRAFVAASFPPIKVGKSAGNNIPFTFEGDTFPQFSQVDKGTFLCEVCVPFQKWAKENGQQHAHLRCKKQASIEEMLAGTATSQFVGLVQVAEHAASECHKQAIAFFEAEEDGFPSLKNLQPSPSMEKKLTTGQQSIEKFFRPLNREGPPDPSKTIMSGQVRCHHFWDQEVVKHFAEDRQIRRRTAKSLFLQEVRSGAVSCFSKIEGHESCTEYKSWCEKHPIDARHLIEKANSSYRSVFVPMTCTINVFGSSIRINGCIKSIDPPCTGEVSTGGETPFTCVNCAKQQRDLKDVVRHREKGSLGGMKDRIGVRGFNQRYAKTQELSHALKTEANRRKEAERQVKELTKVKLSVLEWEKCLMDSCLSCDEEKVIVDLIRLFKMGVSKTNPVQVMVLRNLTSKLLKKNNHHYISLIKDLSGVFKNELGPTNYSLLAQVFGLARQTTASKHGVEERLDPGINFDALSKAATLFKNSPVNEASDGARALRYLQAHKFKDGSICLIGQGWNPDIHSWKSAGMAIPRKDPCEGDKDDFSALKRAIDKLIERGAFAKNVSIHNLTALTSMEKSSVIYCMWPTIDKGYTGKHLLNYWQELRRLCWYDEKGEKRESPIHLLGYSTDSAGFSLSALASFPDNALPIEL